MATAEKALTGEVLTGPPMKIPPALTRMSVSVSENTKPEDIQHYIDVVCEAYAIRDQNLGHLRVLLGRMVFAVKKYKLYQPTFRLFGDYIAKLAEDHKLSDTTIHNAVAMVEQLEGVPTEVLSGMSVKNQNTAAQAARRVEPKRVTEIMKYAALPNPEFIAKLTERGLLVKRGRPDGGSRDTGTVTLTVPDLSARTAKRFRANAAEHGGPAKYLTHLMSLEKSAA